MALRLRLAFVASLAALGAAFSCKTFDIPTESCDPSNLDAQRLHGEGIDGTCSRCLEDKCCDKVGVCTNKNGCVDLVRNVHDCVIKAGPAQAASMERSCAKDLSTISEADSAYRCMRDDCGLECGLPVCEVSPAATLLFNAACDSCFASSCCPQLNDCYGSRACKLSLECINRDCGAELGKALTALHAAGPESLMVLPDASIDICGDAGASTFMAPKCIRNCLCEFQNEDQGLQPADTSRLPFMLALSVYQCGGVANCGSRCTDGGAP